MLGRQGTHNASEERYKVRKHQGTSPRAGAARAVKAVDAGIEALTDNAAATVAKAKSQALATAESGKDKVHAAAAKVSKPAQTAKAKAATLKTGVQDAAARGSAKAKRGFRAATRTP